jgi:hypothetical protein
LLFPAIARMAKDIPDALASKLICFTVAAYDLQTKRVLIGNSISKLAP